MTKTTFSPSVLTEPTPSQTTE